MPNCQCQCGQYTGSSFVRGHQFTHRTSLLSLVTMDESDSYVAGDMDAYDELRERGWLVTQGYGSYGTGRNVPAGARTGNRSVRRRTQRNRSNVYGGHYVPDNAIAGVSTGATFYRADTSTIHAPTQSVRNTVAAQPTLLQYECECVHCHGDAYDHYNLGGIGYVCRPCFETRQYGSVRTPGTVEWVWTARADANGHALNCTRCNLRLLATERDSEAMCTECRQRMAEANRAERDILAPTFGVEIEYRNPENRERVAHAINVAFQASSDADVRAMHCVVTRYGHDSDVEDGIWRVKTDASIGHTGTHSCHDYHGGEIVSPILRGSVGFNALKAVCTAIESLVSFDSSTGVHVHHGASNRNMTVAQILAVAERYTDAQALINGFMPAHRQRNYYAMAYTRTSMEDARDAALRGHFSRIDRYHTVNLAAIAAHGTIEFRQHNGSGTYQALANWVRFGQKLVDACIAGYSVDTSSLESFLRSIDCEERTISYYLTRAERVTRRNSHAA